MAEKMVEGLPAGRLCDLHHCAQGLPTGPNEALARHLVHRLPVRYHRRSAKVRQHGRMQLLSGRRLGIRPSGFLDGRDVRYIFGCEQAKRLAGEKSRKFTQLTGIAGRDDYG